MLFKLVIPILIKTCNKKNWSARLNFKLPAAQSVYRKSYIKKPPGGGGGGAYLFQAYLRRCGVGAYWRRWAYLRGGFINLETMATMVSVLHKELEYKVEKLKSKTF